MFIDFDEMSLQWGMHQVVFMNTVHNDGDTGSIRFEPTPTFNQYTLDRRWIVSVCAAGMLDSEMDVGERPGHQRRKQAAPDRRGSAKSVQEVPEELEAAQ